MSQRMNGPSFPQQLLTTNTATPRNIGLRQIRSGSSGPHFRAWTRRCSSQIRCRFFMQGNGRCPFKSDCIYLHQQPDKALTSDPPWTESMQLTPGSEMALGPAGFLGRTEQENEVFFMNCALAMTFWGSELLLGPDTSYLGLL
ncbi:uncharacterized protein LOC121106109 isoform X4 [Ursus maritimus]|uniref:Uncharacterized protein LOC121106109 isoform X4 n=1 Tax=Ursus maritimus TaxID=29073 RepID=A0A8M1GZG2_URSMA|nr:uncharacterized protein LOC121106109 isoform X4 [Ursus maritimus]